MAEEKNNQEDNHTAHAWTLPLWLNEKKDPLLAYSVQLL